MKSIIFALICASLISMGSCDKNSTANEYDRLSELPPDLAASLDPDTMATKTTEPIPEPVQSPSVAAAPCCSISQRMSLKVRFPYTKCGPLRDFIVAPIGDLKTSAARSLEQSDVHPDFRVFKLTQFNGNAVLDQVICVTGDGPWDATLTEDRKCNSYSPLRTLIISPYGNLVTFSWYSGTGTHPSSVILLSCRLTNTLKSPCSGLSNCDCRSSACPANETCDCGLQSNW